MAGKALRTLTFVSLLLLSGAAVALAAEEGASGGGFVPPVWTIVPFVGMLLSIALFPLVAPHFWEHHFGKISAVWLAIAVILMFVSVPGEVSFVDAYGHEFFKTYEEYIAFIVLLGSLFVISGGIYISGNLPGIPLVNTGIIVVGTILASVIGTTGAAMLLIRPLIRANQDRRSQVHVVLFFVFLVCNVGGSLTPIGDPPLFLGFLQGIPFEWTLGLFPEWLFTSVILIAAFYAMDTFLARRENLQRESGVRITVKIQGGANFLLLLGVVVAVIMSGTLHFDTVIPFFGLGVLHIPALIRDGSQIALAAISMAITAKVIRESNHFNFEPIKEVAYLFIGIFTTMIPALMLLNARGGELGLDSPLAYFWVTGTLSAFLDNAPTYLTFLATAMGSLGIDQAVDMTAAGQPENILRGISLGAVFMGAMTYIGNGPNFMVKAIAEGAGIKMPSFFGSLAYSVVILLPVFFVMTLIFL